jgi:hypothetical protein
MPDGSGYFSRHSTFIQQSPGSRWPKWRPHSTRPSCRAENDVLPNRSERSQDVAECFRYGRIRAELQECLPMLRHLLISCRRIALSDLPMMAQHFLESATFSGGLGIVDRAQICAQIDGVIAHLQNIIVHREVGELYPARGRMPRRADAYGSTRKKTSGRMKDAVNKDGAAPIRAAALLLKSSPEN